MGPRGVRWQWRLRKPNGFRRWHSTMQHWMAVEDQLDDDLNFYHHFDDEELSFSLDSFSKDYSAEEIELPSETKLNKFFSSMSLSHLSPLSVIDAQQFGTASSLHPNDELNLPVLMAEQPVDKKMYINLPQNAAEIEQILSNALSVSRKRFIIIPFNIKKEAAEFYYSAITTQSIEQETAIDWNMLAKQIQNGMLPDGFTAACQLLCYKGNPGHANALLDWVLNILPSFPLSSNILFALAKGYLVAFENTGVDTKKNRLRKGRCSSAALAHLQSALHFFMKLEKDIKKDPEAVIISLWLSFRFDTINGGQVNSPSPALLEIIPPSITRERIAECLDLDPIFRSIFFPESLRRLLQAFDSRKTLIYTSSKDITTNEAFKRQELSAMSGTKDFTMQSIEKDSIKSPTPVKSLGVGFLAHGLRSFRQSEFKNEHLSSAELTALQEAIERDCTTAASLRSIYSIIKLNALNISKENDMKLSISLTEIVKNWEVILTNHFNQLENSTSTTIPPDVVPLISSLCKLVGAEKIALHILTLLLTPGQCRRTWIPEIGAWAYGRLSITLGQRLFELATQYQDDTHPWIHWPEPIRVKIGAAILAEAIQLLKLEDNKTPAFVHSIRRLRVDQLLGIITPSPKLLFRLTKIMSIALSIPHETLSQIKQNTNGCMLQNNSQASLDQINTLVMGIQDGMKLPMFIDPVALPMVIRPMPWVSWTKGGYLTRQIPCFRIRPNDIFQIMGEIQQASSSGKYAQLLHGLDILGSTPWRINYRILSIVRVCWERSIDANADEHGHCTIYAKEQQLVSKSRAAMLLALDSLPSEADRHSMQCDIFYKLAIAEALNTHQGDFYLPHNVDFRGRAYPIPALFSHIGADLCRGLVLFGNQTIAPLGKKGIKWLSIHLANVMGHNKLSFEERLRLVEEMRPKIMACAHNPFAENWWMESEAPWQTLAAAMELAAAWEHPQGPEAYCTSIPIQQDGSCNGLQHYAALGRDVLGAIHVNLAPREAPSDIYAVVAATVTERIAKDANLAPNPVLEASADNNTSSISSKSIADSENPLENTENIDKQSATIETPSQENKNMEIARWIYSENSGLSPIISRKIIKQSVMTSVYGVTLFGATEQIHKRLLEVTGEKTKSADGASYAKQLKAASRYIASLVLSSLGTMFDRSRRIQAWLSVVVTTVCSSVPRDWAETHGKQSPLKIVPEGASTRICSPFALGIMGDEAGQEKELIYPQTPMYWVSPLGFPIIQPYRQRPNCVVHTPLQTVTLKDFSSVRSMPVALRKQVAAFAPNYIHSLDAAHMFMTAKRMAAKNIVFASVHDSYWTTPMNVDILHEELRKAFVELHRRPLLEELRNDLLERFSHHVVPVKFTCSGKKQHSVGWASFTLPPVPEQGSFELADVLNSKYFFN